LVEEVKKYLEKNELPKTLPPGAPERLKRKLTDAREEAKTLQKEYEEDFKEAMQDYLELLIDTANDVLKNGEEAKGKIFILENTVTKDNTDRFDQIMDNKKVPLPEKPAEENGEEGNKDQ
jgi:vacuolar-type H+-ATPase subunit H